MDGEGTTISMSISVFQREFLPIDAACKNAFASAFPNNKIKKISHHLREGFKSLRDAAPNEKEKGLLQTWAKIDADDRLGPLCPGHFFNLSEVNNESRLPGQYRLDGSFIANADKSKVQPKDPNWSLQRMGAKFKAGGSGLDPYDDSPRHEVETEIRPREEIRGQVMSYVANAFSYQQRTAFFMLLVNGARFRMMRWDRSGVIVTEAIDYLRNLKQTRVLLRLLFAFSRLSESAQGRDLTAVRLTPDSCGWKRMDELAAAHPDDLNADERDFPLDDPQIERFERFLNHHKHSSHTYLVEHCVIHDDPTQPCDCKRRKQDPKQIKPTWTPIRNLFRETLSPQWPRFQITVNGRKFLVGKQSFKASGMVGHGTRGFPALDWKTQEIVFLKDTWRPHHAGWRSEGEILEELNSEGIQGVPTVVCHEDVPGQQTVNSQYSSGTREKKVPGESDTGSDQGPGLRRMIHHRLVLKEVCLPSTMFSNARELFKMIYHCITAHRDAYKRCHLIHRDVSAGNMLLYPRLLKGRRKWKILREGILSDWELAKRDSELGLESHRIGTWAYMSRFCLSNLEQPVGIPDELESFVHVALHHSVRFLSSNLGGPVGVRDFVYHYFHDYFGYQGKLVAPPYKTQSVYNGGPLNNMRDIHFKYEIDGDLVSHPINNLLKTLFIPVKARYLLVQLGEEPEELEEDLAVGSSKEVKVLSAYDSDDENIERRHREDSDDDSDEAPKISATESEENKARRREELETVAKDIKTHNWFIKTLESAIFPRTNWPKKDRVVDQLQNGQAHDPRPLTLSKGSHVSGAKILTSRASRKRSREGSSTEDSASPDVPNSKLRKKGPSETCSERSTNKFTRDAS